MARIRSVKPEFWTSEQIVECSPNARLMFIGLWNFCDDYGVHPASIARIKMEVFPNDDFNSDDVRRMVAELIGKKLIVEYVIDGEQFWYVTGWDKHQKPDTKTGKWPRPDGTIGGKIRRKSADHSPNEQRQDADHSPTDKVLGSCSLVLDSSSLDKTLVGIKTPTPVCPHQEIIDLYHELIPVGTQVREWTPARAKTLQARWREKPQRQNLEWWRKFFIYISESEFLTGRTQPAPGRDPFVVSLDWIITSSKFTSIIEGKYHRGAA